MGLTESHLVFWHLRQESNLCLELRRLPFCPLNYGDKRKPLTGAPNQGLWKLVDRDGFEPPTKIL